METFELWSYDVNVEGLEEFAEHTYIRCRDNSQYFDCWGGHESPTQGPGVLRFSCNALYHVADCYRRPVFGRSDTAGIGVYGINGVCHQTANLFLCSSDRVITIEDGVKGYWLSNLAYGIHGDVGPFSVPLQQLFYSFWKATVYNPCYQKVVSGGPDAGHELLKDIREMRSTVLKFAPKINCREMIHKEAALVAKHAMPDLDTSTFKDIHLDFLKEKATLIKKKGIKGEKLANKINEIARQFQKSLAERIGAEAYERLTGLKAGQIVNLVDPRIAAEKDN
jgi:hypothetical protein